MLNFLSRVFNTDPKPVFEITTSVQRELELKEEVKVLKTSLALKSTQLKDAEEYLDTLETFVDDILAERQANAAKYLDLEIKHNDFYVAMANFLSEKIDELEALVEIFDDLIDYKHLTDED